MGNKDSWRGGVKAPYRAAQKRPVREGFFLEPQLEDSNRADRRVNGLKR